MCLRVNKKVRNNHHKEDGYCVAYKVIFHDNTTLFARCDDFVYTIGENVPYKQNENGHEWSLSLNSFEGQIVYFGLHLFLDKRMAKKLVEHENRFGVGRGDDLCKMIKVYYKPEDVIAYGRSNTFHSFDDNEVEKSVVVRKLTIKSLDPIE